eukprot:967414-Prorocentrum_minimum.AAC.1
MLIAIRCFAGSLTTLASKEYALLNASLLVHAPPPEQLRLLPPPLRLRRRRPMHRRPPEPLTELAFELNPLVALNVHFALNVRPACAREGLPPQQLCPRPQALAVANGAARLHSRMLHSRGPSFPSPSLLPPGSSFPYQLSSSGELSSFEFQMRRGLLLLLFVYYLVSDVSALAVSSAAPPPCCSSDVACVSEEPV